MRRLLPIITMSLLLLGGATLAFGCYLVRNLPTIAFDNLPSAPPCPAGAQGSVDLNDKVARFVLAVEAGYPSGHLWQLLPDQPTRYVADLTIPEDAPEQRNHLLQWVRALQLWIAYPRKEIETVFLERVNFGKGALGYRCAALIYFGKAADELGDEEAIFLAGLPRAPSLYSSDAKASAARRQKVLDLLHDGGLIGDAT
ncbi:transglycosylase domain-containing protein [Labrys neptuniae]